MKTIKTLGLITMMILGTSTMFGSTYTLEIGNKSKSHKTEVVINKHGNTKYDTYKTCNCKTCREIRKEMEKKNKCTCKECLKKNKCTGKECMKKDTKCNVCKNKSGVVTVSRRGNEKSVNMSNTVKVNTNKNSNVNKSNNNSGNMKNSNKNGNSNIGKTMRK